MNRTIRIKRIEIEKQSELVDFIRFLGTDCAFISLLTITPMRMIRTGNPFVGTLKISRRNGLVNVNFVKVCSRNLRRKYTPGETHYVHEQNEIGKPIPLCFKKTNRQRFYLQYFPHKTIGETKYWLNDRFLTPREIRQMSRFICEKDVPAFKPKVCIFNMTSIVELKARKIHLTNKTIQKLAKKFGMLA
jgi:hypothetical protein